MSFLGNLGRGKEMYRCGHINPYQNSYSDVFLSLFLTSYGGRREFTHEVPPTSLSTLLAELQKQPGLPQLQTDFSHHYRAELSQVLNSESQ